MTTLSEHSFTLTLKLKTCILGCSTPRLLTKALSLALTLQEDANVWRTTANWHLISTDPTLAW